eukprot:1439440-Heterocapsa_arctica.AAC.1
MKEMHGNMFRKGDYKQFYEQFGKRYFAEIVEKKDGYDNFYEQYGTCLKLKRSAWSSLRTSQRRRMTILSSTRSSAIG